MKKILAAMLAFALLGQMCVLAQTGWHRGRMDVYLLIGQSNMAGRGKLLEQDFKETVEGVYLLDSTDTPVVAVQPYNQFSTVRKSIGMQQMGPGYGFAKYMKGGVPEGIGAERRARRSHDVLLVVNARGGSSIDEWMPGTLLFDEAVRRTREAMKYGRFKGILWHQGESDSGAGKRETYAARFGTMISALRKELGCPDIPVVIGEIARWHRNAEDFNAVLNGIPGIVGRCICVSSEGCTWLRDEADPHFSRDGQIILGTRYGLAMEGLLHKKNRFLKTYRDN